MRGPSPRCSQPGGLGAVPFVEHHADAAERGERDRDVVAVDLASRSTAGWPAR
jgi:hypothetical protein